MVLARQISKADLRQEITAFGLLDWAYRKECVRAAGEEEWAALEGHGMSIIARAGESFGGGIAHGAINGRLDVHIDALRVDKFVSDNCTSELYAQVTVHAEKGRPVPATVELPRVTRCGPKFHENNPQRLAKLYDGGRNWVGCEVCYDGVPSHIVDAAQARQDYLHGQFMALLDALPELRLEKWKVAGRGLDSLRRIIDKGPSNRRSV